MVGEQVDFEVEVKADGKLRAHQMRLNGTGAAAMLTRFGELKLRKPWNVGINLINLIRFMSCPRFFENSKTSYLHGRPLVP